MCIRDSLYSALNGLTLTLISLRYNVFDVVIPALVGTLAFFIGFAVVGATTKRNLSSLTPYVMAALIGMIIVSFVMIGARYFNWAVLSAFSDTAVSYTHLDVYKRQEYFNN